MRRTVIASVVLAVLVISPSSVPATLGPATGDLPDRLTDQEFWRLSQAFSEPGGTFHSDNFVSNEGQFQTVIPDLIRRAQSGGLYIGVGPEQNFTYMAALEPRLAFIVDIRRGNLQEHLLYKAIFEMSATRADVLARLFSRPKPEGVADTAAPEVLFAAFEGVTATEGQYRENLAAVLRWLTERHGFALSAEDRTGIDYIYRTAFFADGPALNYQLTGQGFGRGRGLPTYAELMATDDGSGRQRSYLANERLFGVIRDMQLANRIVPVVGDFAGPRALRAVAAYARERGATVSAFYLSNVEQYLRQDGKWEAFCANVATMPLDERSTFIRSFRGGGRGTGSGFSMFSSSLGAMRDETSACAIPAA